jgi:predicted anti-sigma-YlaC factor YlaD
MKCEDIRELLKSDYLDRESGPRERQAVKEHLAHCQECRNLEKELEAGRVIFKKATRLQPPERVWGNIRESIVSERLKQEERVSAGIFERLTGLFFGRRPVFALAGVLTVIICAAIVTGGIIGNNQILIRQNNKEALAVYSFSFENGDSAGEMGTSIEEYFL